MTRLPAFLLCTSIAVGAGCSKTEKPVFNGAGFTADPAPPGPLNGLFLTTDNGSDQVSAVDPLTRQVKWNIPVGFIPVELEGPHHMTADPGGQFAYLNLSEAVIGSGSGPHGSHGTGTIPGFVLKLSTKDASLAAFVPVDPNPGDLTITPDGKTIYVTHYDLVKLGKGVQAGDLRQGDSNLVVINPQSMSVTRRVPLCPAAHGTRLSPDAKTLYATCLTDEMVVVDLATFTVTRKLLPGITTESPSCTRCPYALSVAPDATVWVSSLGPGGGTTGGGRVDVYDPAANAFDAARSVPNLCGRALFAAFHQKSASPTDYLAYVPEQGGSCGDSVQIYQSAGPGQPSASAGQVALARDACFNAHILMLSPDGKTGYLVCEGDHVNPGTFAFLDLQNNSVISSAPLGVFPDGMAFIP